MDLEKVFAQVEKRATIEYRDPLLAPYGNEELNTETQTKAWQFLLEHEGDGPLITMLGAKGSAKTHFGAAYAARMAQVYPDSMGLLISNTNDQVKQILPIFFKVMRTLDISAEYFNTKKVHGEPYSKVIVIDLDGTGYSDGKVSYILVRSFEATDKLEGFEPDWAWIEEIQDTMLENFRIVFSRVRGTNADNSIFIAGMPEDSEHWQYSFLPKVGFVPAEDWMLEHMPNYDGGSHERTDANGIMFWPKLHENLDNVGEKYLERMKISHSGAMAQRYIFGLPVKTSGNKVFYEYRGFIHKMGRMSKLLTNYEDSKKLIVSVDFNIAPMSASIWQTKGWNDEWDDEDLVKLEDGVYRVNGDQMEYVAPSFREMAAPNREILAQIDELEVWNGGTEGLMERFLERYSEHVNGIVFVGDASGRSRHTSSDTTDWDIIKGHLKNVPNTTVIKGLKTSHNIRTGEVKYDNPSVRNSINLVNRYLYDGQDQAHICFLPKSDVESGGVSRSVSTMSLTPDGRIDKKVDRQEGKEIARTHFADTVRYAVVHHNGGESMQTVEEYEEMVKDTMKDFHRGRNTDINDAGGWAF